MTWLGQSLVGGVRPPRRPKPSAVQPGAGCWWAAAGGQPERRVPVAQHIARRLARGLRIALHRTLLFACAHYIVALCFIALCRASLHHGKRDAAKRATDQRWNCTHGTTWTNLCGFGRRFRVLSAHSSIIWTRHVPGECCCASGVRLRRISVVAHGECSQYAQGARFHRIARGAAQEAARRGPRGPTRWNVSGASSCGIASWTTMCAIARSA